MLEQQSCVGVLKIMAGIFLLGLLEHLAVGDTVTAFTAVEVEVIDILDALHIHGEALEAVGQLA